MLNLQRAAAATFALLMVLAAFLLWLRPSSDMPAEGSVRLSSVRPVRAATAGERRQARAVVRAFARALRHRQHAAMCALLTPETAKNVVRTTVDVVPAFAGLSCASVLASDAFASPDDVPPAFHDAARSIASVGAQRDGDLIVAFRHGRGHGWTLRRQGGDWKIMDAGLVPPTVGAKAQAQFAAFGAK